MGRQFGRISCTLRINVWKFYSINTFIPIPSFTHLLFASFWFSLSLILRSILLYFISLYSLFTSGVNLFVTGLARCSDNLFHYVLSNHLLAFFFFISISLALLWASLCWLKKAFYFFTIQFRIRVSFFTFCLFPFFVIALCDTLQLPEILFSVKCYYFLFLSSLFFTIIHSELYLWSPMIKKMIQYDLLHHTSHTCINLLSSTNAAIKYLLIEDIVLSRVSKKCSIMKNIFLREIILLHSDKQTFGLIVALQLFAYLVLWWWWLLIRHT